MRRVLVLQHMDHDTPGRFTEFLAEDGFVPTTVRLWEGQSIPSLADFDFLFVLGGAQDVWEEERYPWLTGEKAAIREWVAERARPYLGICLGHQLLAAALGGEVALAKESEVGVFAVDITPEGVAHPLFRGFGRRETVMQWHSAEVTRAPVGAVVLASSPTTAIQALAVGDHALGLQFHAEFSAQSIASWESMSGYLTALETHLGPGAYGRLAREAYPLMPAMAAMARRLYDNLMGARRGRHSAAA